MPEEGGCAVFMDWNKRLSFRNKLISTIIFVLITIIYHIVVIDSIASSAPSGNYWGVYGMFIFMGLLGIGPHAWLLGSLINTIYHDGGSHRRIIKHREHRFKYYAYLTEMEREEVVPISEEKWAKENKFPTIQV